VRTEDMFEDDATLENLTSFLGLPHRPGVAEARAGRIDAWRFSSAGDVDWRLVDRHPAVTRLMERYGYSLDDVDHQSIVAGLRDRTLPQVWRQRHQKPEA
jgi:hypothetical protein